MPIAAGKLRVLIATTNGPVEVLLLTEEDAAIGRCVACIAGTTETADIAGAYHDFVVRPTGVIEGRFGHAFFRLDVSARIDAGSSWQLGVLAAHALLAERRLAQEKDVPDGIVWATGSVRAVDLKVGGVGHVAEKLANSLDRLKQERGAGRRVLVALPAANAAEVPPALLAELFGLGIETIALAHARPLFDALAMQLPERPGRISGNPTISEPAATPALPRAAAAPRRRRLFGAAAAGALLGMAATSVVLFTRERESALSSSPKLASVPPAAPKPAPVALVPEQVPFISAQERARIREQYLPAPDYKALAMSLVRFFFVTGQPSQEAADHAAMEVCEKDFLTSNTSDAVCELYASGNVVVAGRGVPPLPPEPWVVRNAAVERPFNASMLPLTTTEFKERADKTYLAMRRPKALVLSPVGYFWMANSGEESLHEAMRRSLERCGYAAGEPCMVIAIDDTFVVPIPTLMKVISFYTPNAIRFRVKEEGRKEVARRLAGANSGWNAVAVGTAGDVGIAIGAGSEQGAIDGALADCAKHDNNCRVAVLGPFLIETRNQGIQDTENP